jgi:iron(III) transport system substrate-binding protein
VKATDARYRSKDSTWVGVSGRARVIAFNPTKVPEAEVPKNVFALTDPTWRGRIGYAPTNASFQSFVTGMRIQAGEARTKEWLAAFKADDPKTFSGNGPVLAAVDEGNVDLGLINHYYLYERGASIGAQGGGQERLHDQRRSRCADQRRRRGHLEEHGGAGRLDSVRQLPAVAGGPEVLPEKTYEYPLIAGVPTAPGLPPLTQIQAPNVDLSNLDTWSRR